MLHILKYALSAGPPTTLLNLPARANLQTSAGNGAICAGKLPLRKYWETVVERGLALLQLAPLIALAEDMGDPDCAVNY